MKSLVLCLSLIVGQTAALAQDLPDPQPLTQEEIDAAVGLGANPDEILQVREPMTRRAREAVRRDMEESAQDLERLSHKTDAALGNLIKRTSWVLKQKGFAADAEQLSFEYESFYTQAVYFTYLGVVPVELGDHAPLNQWLADWYNKIEEKLGKDLCRILHIMDIKILNYGIPVVFNPKVSEQWCVETGSDCKAEYSLHFAGKMTGNWSWEYNGVLGVVSYWSAWMVCTVGTWGGGAITFICSPIATVVEMGVDKYVSPKASDWLFDRVNP